MYEDRTMSYMWEKPLHKVMDPDHFVRYAKKYSPDLWKLIELAKGTEAIGTSVGLRDMLTKIGSVAVEGWSNGTFSVAVIWDKDKERIRHMGVTKRSDRDRVNVKQGLKLAAYRVAANMLKDMNVWVLDLIVQGTIKREWLDDPITFLKEEAQLAETIRQAPGV